MTTDMMNPGRASRPPARRRRTRVLAALGLLLLGIGGYAAWQAANPTVLRAEIEIAATPDEVWTVLTDQRSYPRWNPFLVSSTGPLEPAATLTNVLRGADGAEWTFTPTVLAVDPGRELRWIGRLGPGGLFDGEHAFRIVPAGPGRVRFVQEETFRGVLVPPLSGWLTGDTLPQFRAMNAALATEVADRR